MSVEFVDTNVLIYAFDSSAGSKRDTAVNLVSRLIESSAGVVSTQVLAEFYSVWTRKLKRPSETAEAILSDLDIFPLHRPGFGDLLRAIQLERSHQLSFWDAMVLNSAVESGASILWTEDLQDGQEIRGVTVRNPFR